MQLWIVTGLGPEYLLYSMPHRRYLSPPSIVFSRRIDKTRKSITSICNLTSYQHLGRSSVNIKREQNTWYYQKSISSRVYETSLNAGGILPSHGPITTKDKRKRPCISASQAPALWFLLTPHGTLPRSDATKQEQCSLYFITGRCDFL